MHVINMFAWKKTVQRSIDRRGAWIEIECCVVVHRNHLIFGRGLQTFVGASGIDTLQSNNFFLIERSKVFFRACAEVAARTLDPENRNIFASKRIFLRNLR